MLHTTLTDERTTQWERVQSKGSSKKTTQCWDWGVQGVRNQIFPTLISYITLEAIIPPAELLFRVVCLLQKKTSQTNSAISEP